MAKNNCINSQQPFAQLVTANTTTYSNIIATIPYDNTIPQITEGTEILTCTITPKSATSLLDIRFIGGGAKDAANGTAIIGLFQDATANALCSKAYTLIAQEQTFFDLHHIMASGTTSATTFRIRIGPGANSHYSLGWAGVPLYGGVWYATITITEYL